MMGKCLKILTRKSGFFLFVSAMKNPSRIQKHPHQEDKTGRPLYASRTKMNFSTNDPRTEIDKDIPEEQRKLKLVRIRSGKQK